jgi:uncharacterized protein YraI
MNTHFQIMGENPFRYVNALVVALLLAGILAGCSTPTATPAPVQPTSVPPTAVQPTAVPPTAAPDPAYYENQPVAVFPTGVPGQPLVEAATNTAIRSGPGTNYVVYGAFLGGSTAIAVGISQDSQWYAVSVPVAPGGTGWVSAAYVLAENTDGLPVLVAPPVPASVELVPPQAGDPQVTTLAEVYVRSGPGDTYPAYGIAPTGATALVIGKSQDGLWWTIRLNPQNVGIGYGWVAAAYVQASNTDAVPVVAAPDQSEPVTLPPASSSSGATATAIDYVNLRSGPGTNYYVYGVAAPGATGEVIGVSQDGAWWQVKVPADKIPEGNAWVSASWVTTANTAGVPVVTAPPPPPTNVDTTPPPATSCVLVAQTPADYTTYPPSTGFDTSWTLQNTSGSAWDENSVDLVFVGAAGGMRLHMNYDLYDITQTVQPGANYTVTIPMVSPDGTGQWGEAWELRQGADNVLCTFWVVIDVK